MDPVHFDRIAKSLSRPETRRRVFGLVSAVPVVGGLLNILSPEETEAAGRRRRRKKAHKHGKGRRRKHRKKKTCTPDSVAQTCAGTCGSVLDNCQQTVDCGSCTCAPACAVCFTCQDQGPAAPGTCVGDPAQQGEACGDAGQVCQRDGTCACDTSSCATGQVCQDGVCTCTPTSCPDGCCDGAVCRGREDTACGRGGGACAACAAPATCQQGVCSIYPTYGCTLQDNACTGSGNRYCPDNPGVDDPPFPFSNFCLIAASGYPVCSSFGSQSSCTSDAQCTSPAAVCVVAQGTCITACRAIADPPA